MGASGNEGDAAFEKEKEIINSFVDSLKSNDTQMAVVNYGENGSNVDVKLGQFKDKEDFKSSVDKQERQGEGKALDKALDDTDKVLINLEIIERFFLVEDFPAPIFFRSKIPVNFLLLADDLFLMICESVQNMHVLLF